MKIQSLTNKDEKDLRWLMRQFKNIDNSVQPLGNKWYYFKLTKGRWELRYIEKIDSFRLEVNTNRISPESGYCVRSVPFTIERLRNYPLKELYNYMLDEN